MSSWLNAFADLAGVCCFEHFKKTEAYAEALQSLSEREDMDEEQILSFMFSFYAEQYLSMIFEQ